MIELNGLTKRFGRVTAVDELSFTARRSVTALVDAAITGPDSMNR